MAYFTECKQIITEWHISQNGKHIIQKLIWIPKGPIKVSAVTERTRLEALHYRIPNCTTKLW